MVDANLLRAKISEIKSALDVIEKNLDKHEAEMNDEKQFYSKLFLPEDATGVDFFALMDVMSIAKNSIISCFLDEHGFAEGRRTPKAINDALQSFTAFYIYAWLKKIDKRGLQRLRGVGKKGKEQILGFISKIDRLSD